MVTTVMRGCIGWLSCRANVSTERRGRSVASPWLLAWPARVRSRDGVRRFGSPLLWNLRLDELREQGEGCLPAQRARLGGDDTGHPLLHDAHLRADGDLL